MENGLYVYSKDGIPSRRWACIFIDGPSESRAHRHNGGNAISISLLLSQK